jgi:large subunit ribosomal protein L15
MKYNELKTVKPKSAKRVGRGISAGQGKTAGRGTKGQGARTGSRKKPGFAGGSNPLMQKLPKLPGFKSHRTPSEVIYTEQLNELKATTITSNVLAEANLISSAYVNVKVIVKGDLSKKLTVQLPYASGSAKAVIEAAGGSFAPTRRLQRPKTSTKDRNTKSKQ